MEDVAGDLRVSRTVTIPAAELQWQFSRSSGPGGQSVNTTDSRVHLSWAPDGTRAIPEAQRRRVRARLSERLVDGVVTVTAAEHRSQWQNRRTARRRLAEVVAQALAPPRRPRRRTRPSRGSVERRLATKRRRGEVKRARVRPAADD